MTATKMYGPNWPWPQNVWTKTVFLPFCFFFFFLYVFCFQRKFMGLFDNEIFGFANFLGLLIFCLCKIYGIFWILVWTKMVFSPFLFVCVLFPKKIYGFVDNEIFGFANFLGLLIFWICEIYGIWWILVWIGLLDPPFGCQEHC